MSDYLDGASQKAVDALASALRSSLESAAQAAVSESLKGAGAKMEESANAVKQCVTSFNEDVTKRLVSAVHDELLTHFKSAEKAQNIRAREMNELIEKFKTEFTKASANSIRAERSAALKSNVALVFAVCAATFSFIAAFIK